MIRRVDENWAEGMLGDKIGIFPISYVEVSRYFLSSGIVIIKQSSNSVKDNLLIQSLQAL